MRLAKQAVKVKLVGNSALDLNDPAILEKLLQEVNVFVFMVSNKMVVDCKKGFQ